MKILVICQDLRNTGTSEGIVSRSFIYRLKEAYPDFNLEVLYLKCDENENQSELLQANRYKEVLINRSLPLYINWINRIAWRITGTSLNDRYFEKQYGKELKKVDASKYNYIFLRSSGLNYELILGALENLPLLQKSIVNFHDPFPVYWDTGSQTALTNLELQRLKRMQRVVNTAAVCISPSKLLSQDLEFLYGTKKPFLTVPHQFSEKVFDQDDKFEIRPTEKKISISYHGAVQFGRSLDLFLDAYLELLEEFPLWKEDTELVLRIKGPSVEGLIKKSQESFNIKILEIASFYISYREQKEQDDILLILENSSPHSNILPGKAPVLSSLQKTIFALSPKRSELRGLMDKKYVAAFNDKTEIKLKLANLINEALIRKDQKVDIFKDYFDLSEFKKSLDTVREAFDKL